MYRKESRGKKSNILTTRRFASLLRVRYQYFFGIIHSNNDDDDDNNNNDSNKNYF